MLINTLLIKVRYYLDSLYFPLSIALLAFLTWIMPGGFGWIFALLYFLLTFLPLLDKQGKPYMPLLICLPIIVNSKISFETMPPFFYLIGAGILLSMILFIIIRKPRFQRGDLSIEMLLLFTVFFISFMVASVQQGKVDSNGLLYLISLFGCAAIYIIFSTVLGQGETLSYFSKTVAFLSMAICLEILVYLFKNGFSIVGIDFTLGWSYTSQTASTILCLSLPFYAILISSHKPYWFIGQVFTIAGIIFLSADSGLLCLILGIIPLILLTFNSYKKYYPYICLGLIIFIGVTFGLLLGFNERFSSRVLVAIQSLNLGNEQAIWRKDLFSKAISLFTANPVIGSGFLSMTSENGTLILMSNTVLTTLVGGGSIGLVAFLLFEIKNYYTCLKKKSHEKWLFFLFLIFIELIGLIDNTIYNLMILLFFLIANSSYQMSNRPADVIIYDSFYENYKKLD
jgi:hypothetical protein